VIKAALRGYPLYEKYDEISYLSLQLRSVSEYVRMRSSM
jgi:hypothetical protein